MTWRPLGSNETGIPLPTSTESRPSILMIPSFAALTCSSALFATGEDTLSRRSLLPALRIVKYATPTSMPGGGGGGEGLRKDQSDQQGSCGHRQHAKTTGLRMQRRLTGY